MSRRSPTFPWRRVCGARAWTREGQTSRGSTTYRRGRRRPPTKRETAVAGCVVIHHQRLLWRRAALLPGGLQAGRTAWLQPGSNRYCPLDGVAYKPSPYCSTDSLQDLIVGDFQKSFWAVLSPVLNTL